MAQIPKGRLIKGPYKPICRDCAIYFSITVMALGITWIFVRIIGFCWRDVAQDEHVRVLSEQNKQMLSMLETEAMNFFRAPSRRAPVISEVFFPYK